ncbi:alpha/beta hydrolase [Bacillaceae bacterium W0354]
MGRKGKMINKDINSQYLHETLTIKLFLPENFSELYKYHICIMLDGDDYYQLGRAATLSDKLHDQKEITNTILAGIHYKDRYDRWDKYHPKGEKNDAFIKFLRFEVVPLLDDILPSYYVGSTRILMGDSLAGTVSLMTALNYTNTFGKVVMQSPYVDEHVLKAVQESNNHLETITIYHTIGNNETNVKTIRGELEDFLTPNRKLNEVLKQRVDDYIYYELDGEHTWKQWQKDLPNVFKIIFNND